MRVSVKANNETMWDVDGRSWWGSVDIFIDDKELKLTNSMDYQGRVDMIHAVR